MEIRSGRSEGTARLELHGKLDLGTAPKLDEAVDAALGDGCRDVVLDLAGTTFLDSSGLGALIRAARTVDAQRGEARVVIETSRTGSVVGLRDA